MNDFARLMRAQQDLEASLRTTETKETPIIQSASFTPALLGQTTPGTFTYTSQTGRWHRVDDWVHFYGRVSISAITVAPVGIMVISGLPFTSGEGSGIVGGGGTCLIWTSNLATAHTQLGIQMAGLSSLIFLVKSGDNLVGQAVAAGDIALVGGALDFRFEGQYFIAP
jgi:hypothetical protein